MTLAQLGMPHAQARQRQGWGWITLPSAVGAEDAVQAHRWVPPYSLVIAPCAVKQQAQLIWQSFLLVSSPLLGPATVTPTSLQCLASKQVQLIWQPCLILSSAVQAIDGCFQPHFYWFWCLRLLSKVKTTSKQLVIMIWPAGAKVKASLLGRA